MNNELEFTFRRFEERSAILYNEQTGEIKWPIKNLPDDLKPNDKAKIRIVSPAIEHAEQVEELKKTLEELIN